MFCIIEQLERNLISTQVLNEIRLELLMVQDIFYKMTGLEPNQYTSTEMSPNQYMYHKYH